MFKVNIINASQNLSWSASFPSEAEAQAWLTQQIGKPHRMSEQIIENEDGNLTIIPQEFTSEIIDISPQVELDSQKAAAKKLLADTDWMIIREIDSGIPCPQEIKSQRSAARSIL